MGATTLAWASFMGVVSFQWIKNGKAPPPSQLWGGTVVMGLYAIVAQWSGGLGGALAWATVGAAAVSGKRGAGGPAAAGSPAASGTAGGGANTAAPPPFPGPHAKGSHGGAAATTAGGWGRTMGGG